MTAPPLKDYQERGIAAIAATRKAYPGEPIVVAAPPGAGKSRVMEELAIRERAAGGRMLVKSHRRMLLDQLVRGYRARGMEVAVLNAEEDSVSESSDVIVASTQTLYARAVKKGSIDLPWVTLVANDEAHQQQGKAERALLYGGASDGGYTSEGFVERGADVVGFTGTPMGMRIYKQMVQLCNYSDLRREGMHQWVDVYGPDEIDTSRMKANADGSYSEGSIAAASHTIFGSVFASWWDLNPDAYPSLLFAPSKASSRWFAEQFMAQGVKAAHIDGSQIWMPEGKRLVRYNSTQDVRTELLAESQSGALEVVCNRFVLREAIDMPWIYHAIFATVMGSPVTALQSVGRLQRAWPSYEKKILQDHGGFYWRHGDPNMDREWEIGLSQADLIRERILRCRKGQEFEGIRCPRCGAWRNSGSVCTSCNHTHDQSVRAVRMVRGKLKQIKGSVFTGTGAVKDKNKLWAATLFQMAFANRPVSSAVAVFTKKARASGLDHSLEGLNIPVPQKESLEWDLPVRTVYPWTQKAGRRSS